MGLLFNGQTPTGINFNGNPVNELQYNGVTVWTSEPDYSSMYLTFEALEDGTFSFTRNGTTSDVYYSIDNGTTWTVLASNTQTPTITTGNKILLKSDRTSDTFSTSNFNKFASTGQFRVYGNVMSMIYGDNFDGKVSLSGKSYAYRNMFDSCTYLIDAENLILPATTLATFCYQYMFYGCTSLVTAPAILPATTLAIECYKFMFQNCTSLTKAPELPAATLADKCYQNMFQGCTDLTTAPELPATTLVSSCYSNMFLYCTSLVTAPELPATTLAKNCYNGMFNGCTSLNYIKAMFTTTPSTSYTNNWVYRVSSTGTFVKNSAAKWNVTGVNGIPTGWTVVDA